MFCSNCGKELKEDVRFCPYCGMEQTLQSILERLKFQKDKE